MEYNKLDIKKSKPIDIITNLKTNNINKLYDNYNLNKNIDLQNIDNLYGNYEYINGFPKGNTPPNNINLKYLYKTIIKNN